LRVEAEYKKIGEIYCPALGEKVFFNSQGIDHIKFKRWNCARLRDDQYIRLKLFHLVPGVIQNSKTIQGEKSGKRFERIKTNNRWEQKMVSVIYYEFIAITNGCRLRVIVKKVENGRFHFWSVIPYWKQSPQGKKMFEGDPEED
jgi:hypothetical protein